MGPVLITSTEDRILLHKTDAKLLLGGTDQTLRVRAAFANEDWDVPVSFAAAAWLAKPPADTPFDPARWSWLPADRNRDIVRLRNGDTAGGTRRDDRRISTATSPQRAGGEKWEWLARPRTVRPVARSPRKKPVITRHPSPRP